MIRLNFNDIAQEEWDWLVGLYLADGSKFKEKHRAYRIFFYLDPKKDRNILLKLSHILKSLGLRENTRIVARSLRVRVTSKELYDKLLIKNSNKQNYFPIKIDAFIAGFFDGDGFIRSSKLEMGFSQSTVKWICNFIANYFISKGVNPWVFKKYRNSFYYTTSLKNVINNTNVIDFMVKAGGHPMLNKIRKGVA